MKYFYLLFLCQLLIMEVSAQEGDRSIHLKGIVFDKAKNLQNKKLSHAALRSIQFRKKLYILIQFDKLPDSLRRRELKAKGIILSAYIPGNAYMAEMPDSFNLSALKQYAISGSYAIAAENKISEKLKNNAGITPNSVVSISFFGSITKKEVIAEVERLGARLAHSKIEPDNAIFVYASYTTIQKLSTLPFVAWINDQGLKDTPLNYNNRATHALNALSALSGRNLQGYNVTIGIGDDADPSTHLDFTNRLILRTPAAVASHGTHTTGITGGGGIINPIRKGMAPKATFVNQFFSDILVNSATYMTDYNMMMTNNSYYTGLAGCPGNGEYDVLSSYIDAQLKFYPTLLHVFAAGNDGGFTCSATPFYATIKSGFQCGKNVLTVGNMNTANYLISSSSSRGPVDDGRLKPEIVAGGTSVNSTLPNNTYGNLSGTSMAAPTVTGTVALLYERYRQLHSNANPDAALIKAVLCNGADDLGTAGPDYTYGFGMLNARNAVEALENTTYFTNTITNGGNATHTITGIPAGAQQLKIMLYWTDNAAVPYAASALVNNLDLTVTAPGPTIHQPLILNPANVTLPAIEGTDSRNNIEQIVIDNPPAGNFTISVSGTSVPAGSQNYVVVYELINPSVTVEYPFGNETWVPGDAETIRWSAYGNNTNRFTIEYSRDGGTSWILINDTVPAASRSYSWTIPDSAITSLGRIRVTRNVDGYSDMSDYNFTILPQPTLTVTNPCIGYAQLVWRTISSATSYEIMMLKADSMQTIATTTDTSYLLSGLNKNSSYWLAVRALNGTTAGRRSLAVNVSPSGGACSLGTFNNDFMVDSLMSPLTGRKYTSSQLGIAAIQVRLKNLGTSASSGSYNISYQVNNGSIVTESNSTIISSGGSSTYVFTQNYDFSATGTYSIKTWVHYPTDTLPNNDTITTVIKHLQNDAITLSPSFTEGFENAIEKIYTSNTVGLDSLDRCDLKVSSSNARARTFVNTGFPRTGNRCITLDEAHNLGPSSSDSLITTFNLSNYSSSDQLWLDFYYKNHGVDFTLGGNKVWIRGSETDAWIPVFTLPITIADFGSYQPSGSINIKETLANAAPAQAVSSSFQVKFGQQGYTSANSVVTDGDLDDGYSFDDVKITLSSNDVGVQSLVNPDLNNICSLSASEPIRVQVKNYSASTLNNIAVSYDINGTIVTENIPTLTAGQVLIYTFTQTANLSPYQQYNMRTWVHLTGDNYSSNDSLLNIVFYTSPVISSYPYVQGFESNNGYWHTGGINSSWEWGVPANTIINAAASGTKAWVTNLNGDYNNGEQSYLYSPCFNLSSIGQPVLSFSHIFRTEDNCNCDYHWVEYSLDGTIWTKLGAVGGGTTWYDNVATQAWKASNALWHTSSYDIPTTASSVRFRLVMSSDAATTYEGVGIDNINVFDNTPLPLQLGPFTVVKDNTGALLQWSTFQEFNTDKFIVEKSLDGTIYSSIGEVKAAGNSSTTKQYQFNDEQLLPGVNYYRLRSVDMDGKFSYSPVRTIDYNTGNLAITIYPNPTSDGSLYINSSANCIQVELSDISGRIIKIAKLQGKQSTFSLKGIAKGTYFVSVTTTEGKKIIKIVNQ